MSVQHVIKCYGLKLYGGNHYTAKKYRKVYLEMGFTFTLLYGLQNMDGKNNRAKHDYH